MANELPARPPRQVRDPRDPEMGVLLMAYGAPDRLEDVAPFLLDVRGGRETPEELVAEVAGRYAAIGGGSPLLGMTRAQASALQVRLNGTGGVEEGALGSVRVAVGMRHWRPRIAEAVAELAAAGCRTLVAIPLAPHVSRMSVGAYVDALDRALRNLESELGGEPFEAVHRIEGFHDHPLFLDAWADRVRSALARSPGEPGGDLEILFTAHSLPTSILADGDPYPDQLAATARLVIDRLAESPAGRTEEPPFSWRLCYQSAGARAVPWLGPAIGEVLVELAAAGRRRVLAVPIGFVSDHVEVLYDLDLEAREQAATLGLRFERTESLNTSPRFIDALAELVRRAAS